MQPPYSPPPIPNPIDPNFAGPIGPRGDWASAPKIVKGWAYPLTWLGIVVLPIVMGLALFGGGDARTAERIGAAGGPQGMVVAIIYGALWAYTIWLNRSLKKGAPAAWAGQIALSALGLLGFPVGTIIHGYILSQWFKPEVKAWFGQR
jgi:hypothetical protein